MLFIKVFVVYLFNFFFFTHQKPSMYHIKRVLYYYITQYMNASSLQNVKDGDIYILIANTVISGIFIRKQIKQNKNNTNEKSMWFYNYVALCIILICNIKLE